MNREDQRGEISLMVVSFGLVCLCLIGVIVFAVWAYSGRQDYKNNVDQKITAANAVVKNQVEQADAKNYAEQAKQPLRTYVSSAQNGSVTINYPKTWSGYVSENANGGNAIDGYFYPGIVPSTTDQNSTFALRVVLSPQQYSDVLNGFSSQQQQGQVTIKPFSFKKVPQVVGTRIDGQIAQNKTGSMVIVPLRNQTLQIWTESQQFESDFNNNILPNFSFSP